MIGAGIILGALVVIGVILYISDRLYYKNDRIDDRKRTDEDNSDQGECCGTHIVCEKESLSPFTTEKEYYDDEELDRFAGRRGDEYTYAEEEEFREIMLSMREDELAGWSRALQVRGITLPEGVREELIMMIREARER